MNDSKIKQSLEEWIGKGNIFDPIVNSYALELVSENLDSSLIDKYIDALNKIASDNDCTKKRKNLFSQSLIISFKVESEQNAQKSINELSDLARKAIRQNQHFLNYIDIIALIKFYMEDKKIKDKIAGWVQDGLKIEDQPLVIISAYTKEIVRQGLTTTQLRKFFGAVKRIDIQYQISDNAEDEFKKNIIDFHMLKPILAYSVGRAKGDSKKALTSLYDVLSEGIDNVKGKDSYKNFQNFVQIFEAIVAYHKYHESLKQVNSQKEN